MLYSSILTKQTVKIVDKHIVINIFITLYTNKQHNKYVNNSLHKSLVGYETSSNFAFDFELNV